MRFHSRYLSYSPFFVRSIHCKRSRAYPWRNQWCFLDSCSGPSSNQPRVPTQRRHIIFGRQSSRDQTLFSPCSRALAPFWSSKRHRRWSGDWQPRVMAIRYVVFFAGRKNSMKCRIILGRDLCEGLFFFFGGPWRFIGPHCFLLCPWSFGIYLFAGLFMHPFPSHSHSFSVFLCSIPRSPSWCYQH